MLKNKLEEELIKFRLDIVSRIHEVKQEFYEDINKWAHGNEEAGQRARVSSNKLTHLLKYFRKVSYKLYLDKLNKIDT